MLPTVALVLVSARTARFFVGKDRKSTRLNSSHSQISYAVFCLKKKKIAQRLHISMKDLLPMCRLSDELYSRFLDRLLNVAHGHFYRISHLYRVDTVLARLCTL